MRALTLPALVAVSLLLAACGGDASPPAPAGAGGAGASAEQPLGSTPTDPVSSSSKARLNEAHVNDAATSTAPICELVSAAHARAILGAPIAKPATAPQGPTCIYRVKRTPKGEDPRDGFVTLAVQNQDIGAAKRRLRHARQITVGDRVAYCGERGQSMLLIEVARGELLNVTGSCDVARRFVAQALQRLAS